MHEINRGLIILKPKQPLVDWVNSWSDVDSQMSLDEAIEYAEAILIPEYEMDEEAMMFVSQHAKELFEHALLEWCLDKSMWPKEHDYKTFCEWFDVQLHPMVFDMVEEEMEEDQKSDLN